MSVEVYRAYVFTYSLQFDALLYKCLSCRLRNIASDAANLKCLGESGVGEDVLDDRTTLVACGTEDSDKLGHCSCARYSLLNGRS
jgi:hypothetical protein